MSINRVALSGNLTRDPEIRQTSGGTAVLTFGIAVNDRRKNGDKWEDYPNFIDVAMFGPVADSLSKILVKGMKIALEGKLRWSQWEKDGEKRNRLDVVADSVDFMTKKSTTNQQQTNEESTDDIQF